MSDLVSFVCVVVGALAALRARTKRPHTQRVQIRNKPAWWLQRRLEKINACDEGMIACLGMDLRTALAQHDDGYDIYWLLLRAAQRGWEGWPSEKWVQDRNIEFHRGMKDEYLYDGPTYADFWRRHIEVID